MTKGPLALLFVLSTLISISYMQGCCIQASYAVQQEEGVRTLGIKVYLLKSEVEQGAMQTINFQVVDGRSHQPIGGAITTATVNYADGKTVRQFNTPTDISGRSSISWRIERNAPAGHYDVVYSVFQTGYEPGSFGSSFSVVAHGVNEFNEFNHYDNSPSSSSSSLSGFPFPGY